jgi:hypothetical protein
MMPFLIISVLLLAFLLFVFTWIRKKHMDLWLGAYLQQRFGGRPRVPPGEPIHILFCMVDHFEPRQAGSSRDWTDRFPRLAEEHRDSNGRPLQHTWFYPGEAYDAEHLEAMDSLCRAGYGEIELHHHHHHATSDTLRSLLHEAIEKFARHGLLTAQVDGHTERAYGFIHGDMALDNSRFDPMWCGVNDELAILEETGCYADFSAPTAPCISQPRKINSIYYALDDPFRPKSHDRGVNARVGGDAPGGLLMIQGPLALNWKRRKMGIFPTIENPEIHSNAMGTPDRIRRWVKQHVHVKGRPEWIFVKVSCHGAEERNLDALLGDGADRMYGSLENGYRDRPGFRLHYLTAREMYNIVKAAESGKTGDPFGYRDFHLERRRQIS